MNYKEFFKVVGNLDNTKYHTCCEIKDMETCHWVIFRKDMSFEEYWSSDNKPILDSNINSDEDLIEFCERCKNEKSINNNKTTSRFRERIRQLFRRAN